MNAEYLNTMHKEAGYRPVLYNPFYAQVAGSVAGGVFLARAIYWSVKKSDGWFYQTREEWEQQTYLTRRQQEAARTELRRLKVLEERQVGLNRTIHFRINFATLIQLLESTKCTDGPVVDSTDVPVVDRTNAQAT